MEITEIGLLAIKQETNYGVDAAPGAANVIPVVGDSLTYEVQSTAADRKAMDGTHDRIAGFNTMLQVTLKFRYEMRGNGMIQNGDPANPVEIDALLQAANLSPAYSAESEAESGDGFVAYTPAIYTDNGPGVTCYWWSGLKLHKLTGGKVDLKLTAEVGQMFILEFTVMGKYSSVADATMPAGVSFNGTKPPLVNGSIFNLAGFIATISKFEFELGNQIKPRKSAASPDGIGGFVITGSKPRGRLDPESVSVAAQPYWTKWKSSTLIPIILSSVFQSGNNFQLVLNSAELKSVNYAARDEMRIHQAEFNLVKSVSPLIRLLFA
jgi:Phage tail tube protein